MELGLMPVNPTLPDCYHMDDGTVTELDYVCAEIITLIASPLSPV